MYKQLDTTVIVTDKGWSRHQRLSRRVAYHQCRSLDRVGAGIRHLVGVHTPGEAPPSVISDSDRGPTCERVLQLFIAIRHPDFLLQILLTVLIHGPCILFSLRVISRCYPFRKFQDEDGKWQMAKTWGGN